jgi:transcriptional regulator with XRE-family HTH domain
MAETIGRRLRDLRLRAGLTQEALAERSGVLIGTIRNWEQDQRSPAALLALYRLAQAIGLPMERFVEGIEEAAPPEPEPPTGRARPRRKPGEPTTGGQAGAKRKRTRQGG